MMRTATPFTWTAGSTGWLAALAHELRSPLQPLRCFLALARRRGLADGELRRSLEGAERQLDLLQRLVDDLACLSHAAWQPERLLRQRVPLRDVVQQGLDGARLPLAAREQALVITLDPGPHWVLGDADRLLQVVANLLANAVKYTPAGGCIGVRLHTEGAVRCLEIRDNGPGLAEGEAALVFQPFILNPAVAAKR